MAKMITARNNNNETIFEKKDAEQSAIREACKLAGYKCTFIAATGVGKTRAMLLVMKDLMMATKDYHLKKWLYITPYIDLKDQLVQEAKQWGLYDNYAEYLEIECIATARNFKGQRYAGVFVDEVHTTLANDLETSARKFYLNNKLEHCVCCTATLPENPEHRMFLVANFPVCYTILMSEAKDKELVANFLVLTIPVQLDDEESKKLRYWNTVYMNSVETLSGDLEDLISNKEAFNIAQSIIKKPEHFNQEEKSAAYELMNAIRKRRELLTNSKSKITAAVRLIKLLSVDLSPKKTRRFLTFSTTIQAAKILSKTINTNVKGVVSAPYHSSSKKSLQVFKTTEDIHGLCTVNAANVGLDIPNVEYMIALSMTSKSLTFIQRLGRVARWGEDKLALAIVPYIKGTQDEKWMKSATSQFKTIDVKTPKEIKKQIQIANYEYNSARS